MTKLKQLILFFLIGLNVGAYASLPNTIWVGKNGSDTRGSGTLTAPYLTITKAKSVATAGQTIRVMPGFYAENNLLKRGVNIVGEAGAHLLYVQTTTNDAGWGLFDDRTSGATTNEIIWPGNMVMIALTNMTFYDTVADDGTFPFNLNTAGGIVVTNPATKLKIKGGVLSYTACSFDVAGATAINAIKGSLILEFDVITNLLHGTTLTAGVSGVFPLFGDGIDTADAHVHLNTRILFGDTYSWFWHSTNLLATNDVYISADKIIGPMYGDSASDNTRGWVRAFELDTAGVGTGQGIGAFTSGKWYFTIDKIKSDGTAIKTVGSTKTNVQVWVTTQKIEPGTLFVDATVGDVYLTTMQPNGSHATGMTTSGNGRIFPTYGTSGSTNISAAATSLVIQVVPPMLSTNYTPAVSLGFNTGSTNFWFSALTRSNFTLNFPAGGSVGGTVFWRATQNAQ